MTFIFNESYLYELSDQLLWKSAAKFYLFILSSFIVLLAYLFIYSFVYLLTYLFNHAFICLFIFIYFMDSGQ